MGQNLIVPSGVRTLDATGKLVIPGGKLIKSRLLIFWRLVKQFFVGHVYKGVDASTYFEYFTSGTRTADDFFSGTKAAISGGTTTISNWI